MRRETHRFDLDLQYYDVRDTVLRLGLREELCCGCDGGCTVSNHVFNREERNQGTEKDPKAVTVLEGVRIFGTTGTVIQNGRLSTTTS